VVQSSLSIILEDDLCRIHILLRNILHGECPQEGKI